MDYYQVLGVEKNASDNTIKQAYKTLAKKHHPDLGGDENQFKQISEAYDTLKNPETRQAYDARSQFGGRQQNRFEEFRSGRGMEDILRQMEEQMAARGGGFRPRQTKNHNLNITLNVTLDELIMNETDVSVEKHLSIRMSNGERELVKVNIPPYIQHGETLHIAGLGDNANPSLTRGDLYVTIMLSPHKTFEKKGLDLVSTMVIDSLDAILGCEEIIQTLSGKNLKVKIPAGTDNGQVLNLRDEGLRFREKKGSIFIQVSVKTPKNLTPKQLDFIKKAKSE